MTMSAPVKKIGLISMIFLSLNGMVGSGLFLLPGQVAEAAGQWGLLVYMIVALIIMSLGWCYIKCASHFTRNGGAYLYAKEAFGDFVGFEVGLMRWTVGMIALASLTVGFIVALSSIWPQVMQAPLKQILIIGIIGGLGIVNIFGADVIKKFNNAITVTKALLVVGFIVGGIFFIQPEHVHVFEESFKIDTFGFAALIIFFAFSGFEAITVVAAETDNPKKNIPRAMIISIFICSFLYLLVQLICIGVLGDTLKDSASPIADIAQVLCGEQGKFIVSLAMLLSIGGVIVVSSFITPRSCQVLAEDHAIFAKFVKKNRYGAPYAAIMISSITACVIALSGSFLELVAISAVSRFVQHSASTLALFSMEKKKLMQPFSKPWKKAIPVFAIVSILWLLAHAELYHILYGFGALAVGVPLYLIQKRFLEKPIPEEVVI